MYHRNLANYAPKPLNAFRSSRILFRKRRVKMCTISKPRSRTGWQCTA